MKKYSIGCLAVLILTSTTAFSAQRQLGLEYGLEYSDNIFARSADKEDDLSHVASIDLVIDQLGRRFRYGVDARLSYQEYENSGIEDDFSLKGGMQGQLRIIDDRLVWDVRNTGTQRRIAANQLNSANNSEFVNNFSTGPIWTLKLNERTIANLSANYARTYYEFSKASQLETLQFSSSLTRRVSRLLQVGVKLSHVEVDREITSIDETRETLNLFMTRVFKRSQLDLSAGRSFLDNDLGNDRDFSVYSLDYTHRLNSRLNGSLAYTRSVNTQGETFGQRLLRSITDLSAETNDDSENNLLLENIQGALEEAIANGELSQNSGFQLRENVKASISGDYNPWAWQFSIYHTSLENPQSEFELEESRGVALEARTKIKNRIVMKAKGRLERRDASNIEADETKLGLNFSYRMTKDFKIGLDYEFKLREQDQASDVEENTVFLSVNYQI